MSIHTIATHVAAHDTAAHLTYADEFLRHMDLDHRLEQARDDSARGAKARLGTYTAHGIACATYEIVANNNPYSIKAILDALWFRYTDDEMKLIGLERFRTPGRVASMTPPLDATAAQRVKRQRVYEAEYQRLWQAVQRLFGPMDDTPLVANHTKSTRPTRTEVRIAAQNPDLTPKTALKHDVLNGIIAAALHVENDNRHPGTTLHQGGILQDHEGHLAIDETHVAVGSWGLPRDKAPGNYLARTHAHSKVYKGAPSVVGLTLAVTAARPTQANDTPLVCLGASLHHPTGGLGSAVITIVDAITANDLRAPQPANRGQYAVFDGGYTESINLNRYLTNRSYGMVIKYATDQRTLHEIGPITHDDGARTPGIRLFNGRPLCPGASTAHLARTHLQVPDFYNRKNPDGSARPYTGEELAERADTLQTILPLVMSTSGRPKETENKTRGGQSKNAAPRDTVMRVTLICPHIKGTARCPIYSNYNDPEIEHLPTVPAPPTDLPFHQRPTCCNNDSGTISARIPHQEYKDWQDFMPGTWEHADWYSGPRSANERYNATLKRACGGSNLNKGSIAARKAAPFALFTAMTIAHANRRSIETWYARIDSKGGTKPGLKAHDNKARRDKALHDYLDAQKPKTKVG